MLSTDAIKLLSEKFQFGLVTANFPFMVSSSNLKFESNAIFFPRKLFSLIPKPKVLPEVPVPAAALISPVGFSSIVIFKILDDHKIRTILKLHNFSYYCTKSFYKKNNLNNLNSFF